MTPKQIKLVRTLLIRAELMDTKDEVILTYTEGRTTHISEMKHHECNALVTALRQAQGDTSAGKRASQVRKMLSLAHEMKWETQDGKVNMERLNEWCVKYSPVHLPLDEITDNDLPKVVTIFEKVHMSFLNGL